MKTEGKKINDGKQAKIGDRTIPKRRKKTKKGKFKQGGSEKKNEVNRIKRKTKKSCKKKGGEGKKNLEHKRKKVEKEGKSGEVRK